MNLTAEEEIALRDLFYGETLDGFDRSMPSFPGAIGAVGPKLARKGLAVKVGVVTYEKGCRFVKYRLTPAGLSIAHSLQVEWKKVGYKFGTTSNAIEKLEGICYE